MRFGRCHGLSCVWCIIFQGKNKMWIWKKISFHYVTRFHKVYPFFPFCVSHSQRKSGRTLVSLRHREPVLRLLLAGAQRNNDDEAWDEILFYIKLNFINSDINYLTNHVLYEGEHIGLSLRRFFCVLEFRFLGWLLCARFSFEKGLKFQIEINDFVGALNELVCVRVCVMRCGPVDHRHKQLIWSQMVEFEFISAKWKWWLPWSFLAGAIKRQNVILKDNPDFERSSVRCQGLHVA